MSPSCVPKYLCQREASRADRAYTRIDGKKIKLGAYGSLESKAKYAKLIGAMMSLAPNPSLSRPALPPQYRDPFGLKRLLRRATQNRAIRWKKTNSKSLD